MWYVKMVFQWSFYLCCISFYEWGFNVSSYIQRLCVYVCVFCLSVSFAYFSIRLAFFLFDLSTSEEPLDMSLSKLWESVMDREAWCAVVRGVTKSRTQLNKLNWTEEPLIGILCSNALGVYKRKWVVITKTKKLLFFCGMKFSNFPFYCFNYKGTWINRLFKITKILYL